MKIEWEEASALRVLLTSRSNDIAGCVCGRNIVRTSALLDSSMTSSAAFLM